LQTAQRDSIVSSSGEIAQLHPLFLIPVFKGPCPQAGRVGNSPAVQQVIFCQAGLALDTATVPDADLSGCNTDRLLEIRILLQKQQVPISIKTQVQQQ